MGKSKSRVDSSTVLFDVFYEDGSRASNRKVPAGEVAGLDGDGPALAWMITQERTISELSGKPQREIKKLVRTGR